MESAEVQIDENFGKCRCCLFVGNHKNLAEECMSGNNLKSYSDMLVECFDVILCTDERLPPLICLPCIQLLRNAYNFKTKVMDVEKQLVEWLSSDNGKGSMLLDDIKQETIEVTVKIEHETDEFDGIPINDVGIRIGDDGIRIGDDGNRINDDEIQIIDDGIQINHGNVQVNGDGIQFNGDGIQFNGDDLPQGTQEEEVPSHSQRALPLQEKEFLSRFPRGSVQKLPTVSTLDTYCPEFARHLKSLKGIMITARTLQEYLISRRVPRPVSETSAQIWNVTTVLVNSNLIAFKSKFQNGYPCFYCWEPFPTFQLLRIHQEKHKKEDIRASVIHRTQGSPDRLVVYVESSNLKCKVCDSNIPSLYDLKEHLVKEHQKTLHPNCADIIIPFGMHGKMYRCQVCLFDFETFGSVEKHMTDHYRNFACDECGAGFVTKHRLNTHVYSIHRRVGEFSCEICKKSFRTRSKMKCHTAMVHAVTKKLKCPKCSMRFTYYAAKLKHLVEVHGEEPLVYKCKACEKTFKKKHLLSNHVKKDHMDEKTYVCDDCPFSSFDRRGLESHIVIEHGVKLFECHVCKKSYSKERSLKLHLVTHAGARFCCASCGKCFMHGRSLRLHMKRHVNRLPP